MFDFNMTEVMIQLIGGFGLLLYVINIIGEGLQNSAGDLRKSIIEILVKNRFMAVIDGMIVTSII